MATKLIPAAPAIRLTSPRTIVRARLALITRGLTQVSLAVLIVVLPIRYSWLLLAHSIPPVYDGYTNLMLYPSDLALGALLISWTLHLIAQPKRLSGGPRFLFWPLAGLTVLGLISVAYSVDPLLSLYHALRLIALLGLYLYLVNEMKSLQVVTVAAIGQVVLQAAIGIAEVLRQHSIGLEALGEHTLDPAMQGVSVVVANNVRSLRAYGLTDHPNILGGCLALGLLLIVTWHISSRSRWSTVIGGIFAIGTVGLLLTFSRSAWVALIGGSLAIAVLLIVTRQRLRAQRWFGLMIAGLIAVLPFAWSNADYLGVRLNVNNSFVTVASEDQALGERVILAGLARGMIADRPWGVGLGTFPIALHEREPDYPFNYQPPHQVLLEAASELGVIGGGLYFVMIVAPWIALILNRRRLIASPALIGLSGLILAVSAIGVFDYYTWLLAPGRLWLWLSWGLWGAMYQAAQQ